MVGAAEPASVPDATRAAGRLSALPKLLGDALRLVWSAAPTELAISVALRLVNGLGLGALLLFGRDALAGVLAAGRAGPGGPAGAVGLLPRLVTLAAVGAVLGLSGTVAREVGLVLRERVTRHAQGKILDVTGVIELEAYEDPAFHDRLSRAAKSGQVRPMQLVDGGLGLAGGLGGVLGVTGALLTLQAWLVPLVYLAAVPLLVAAGRAGQEAFGFHCRWTAADRQRHYVYGLLTEKASAQELRAYVLAGHLRDRYERLYDQHLTELRKLARRRLRLMLTGTFGMSAPLLGLIGLLLYLAVHQRLTLAEAGTAAGAVLILGERLTSIVTAAAALYESAQFVADFQDFAALRPVIEARRPAGPAPRGSAEITVENLTFTYPSLDRPALTGVSLRIRPGEIVALVGANGSGKTTLAKLLSGLYRPQQGRIRWDGVDLAGVDPDQLRRQVAVIFQDFLHYALPARDNIGLGRHERSHDLAGITAAAEQAGAHPALAGLPDGYDTVLDPQFHGGKDLSVGQWQRVALARAFFRDAPLVILDEPTAALDARAEHDLFEHIRTLCAGRSVLLISHRFSSVRTADHIYVLDHGQVIEHGSHRELMDGAGHYAELFTLQARAYLPQTPDG